MQQTTCGEIPKIKKTNVLDRSLIDNFLIENNDTFKKLSMGGNCIYSKNPTYVLEDVLSNYLNVNYENNLNSVLKGMLQREYTKLNSIYPKLGSLFLEKYFTGNLHVEPNNYFLHEDSIEDLYKSLNSENAKLVVKNIIENASLEFSIDIKSTKFNEILIKNSKNINFRVDYDSSYLGSKSKHKIKNFKYIIIDGRIDSIGEIYHLLYKAAEEKIPYVIFCFGVRPEVKDVIIQNNAKGITEILPVCMNFDENTINILGDLSVVLCGDVVTAQKGQTISQEVRKELNFGKEITFDRSGFVITPKASPEKIESHRKFLEKRIKKSSNEKNRNLLIARKKRMSSKSMEIFLPEFLLKDYMFRSDLDYSLRLITNGNKVMSTVSSSTLKRKYFVPKMYLDIMDKSLNSLNLVFNSIDKSIVYEDDKK